jgi:Ca2+-transporting ATPase
MERVMTEINKIENPWTLSIEETLNKLDVSFKQGLSPSEAKNRKNTFGKNQLRQVKQKSAFKIFIDQFASPIMALLAVAAVLSFAFGQVIEGIAIIAVILLTVAIGYFTELKAIRSMEALRQMSRVTTNVRRDGRVQQVAAQELVPGDIVILDGGDIVTADMRLLEANKLQADESPLTGESVPVSKTTESLEKKTPLAERNNMLYKGTTVTRGSGEAVVVITGMETELGKISTLVEEATEETTPIEKRMGQLAHSLIFVTIGLALVVAVVGIIQSRDIFLMIETAIALAVAAIPEGLAIVTTVALARGVLRMAKRNALVNNLSSVETLGSTNVIFTDKTGTLTENKMSVVKYYTDTDEIHVKNTDTESIFYTNDKKIKPEQDNILAHCIKVGVLCNNASLNEDNDTVGGIGDPLEVALLDVGARAGMYRTELLKMLPEKKEVAFDPDTKMMATFHEQNDHFYIAIKGAPEQVLENCTQIRNGNTQKLRDNDKEKWNQINEQMAKDGLRVLALASRETESVDDNPYQNMTFLGLVGLHDPPRKDMEKNIHACQAAGINVVMVTGDQPVTAQNVAEQIDLVKEDDPDVTLGDDVKKYDKLSNKERNRILDEPIFARVSPEQKLDLISIHQKNNDIVAMTGDGVNDAPALKKADIGIAMGKRGTQVAKEASDMILKDDAFSTIIVAIRFGRVIFKNIRKFIMFLLSGNVGEVLAVATASLFGLPLPLLPLQILFLNLILDVFPALALGVGEGDKNIMKQPPRDPDEPVLAKRHWLSITGYGVVIAAAVIGALLIALYRFNMSQDMAVTVSFLTLAFARLWHVFNMRDSFSNIISNEITKNPFVWGAILLCVVLISAAIFVPFLSTILKTAMPNTQGWIIILVMSLIPLIIGQIVKIASNFLTKSQEV